MIKNLLRAGLFAVLALFSAPASAQFSAQQTWQLTSTGSANAYALTIPNASSLADLVGVPLRFQPGANNTTASNLNVNSFGNVAINKPSSGGPVALTGGELVTTQTAEVVYDGTRFLLTSNLNAVTSFLTLAPQGYLTPCNYANSPSVSGCAAGNLVPTGDVSAATALYYQTGPNGNEVPIWNGSTFVPFQVPELTLTLGSTNLANGLYDACIFNNGGTPTIVTSVAWSTSTLGSGNRGSGAGTAQIEKVNGIWVNAVAISGKNGASTFSIPADQCTVVATLLMDGTNGQVSFTRSWGQNRKWSIYNFYNKQNIVLQGGDSTGTPWTYNSLTVRPSNNNSANNIAIVTGLPLDPVESNFVQTVAGNTSTYATIGIGLNVTNAFVGKQGHSLVNGGNTSYNDASAEYILQPTIGANTFYMTEATVSSTNIVTFVGTQSFMMMIVRYRG